MPVILGLAGSVRTRSYNASLLRVIAELAPTDCRVEIASIAAIPLYDGDLEQSGGIPSVVAALKDRIVASDGLLLVTPEYNNSLPGTFKNAIDWLTRPASDIPRVFGGRAVALAGATPGPGGTRLSQTAWLAVLRALGTRPFFGRGLFVSDAAKVFDAEGRLTDERVRDQAQKFIAGFAAFVKR
jgi:NAD(P)H-dependent FMN reductase